MTQWTEAAIAAALEGHYYGIDGKCRNDERKAAEQQREEARRRAETIRAMRQQQAQQVIVEAGDRSPSAIIAAVAHAHNLGVSDIISGARFKHIAHARQHACSLMRELTGIPFTRIAASVGIVDHSTAHHAVKTWAARGHLYEVEDRKAREMLGVAQ